MVRSRGWFCAAILVGAAAALSMSAAGPERGSVLDTPFESVSRPSDHRELAFPVRGRVATVHVKAGDELKPGDPVMQLEDTVQRLMVELAQMQAEDTTPLRAARSALAFREQELKLNQDAKSESGANPRDVRAAQYETDQARIKLESVEMEHAAAQVQLAQHRAQLDEMTIKCPVECIVLDVSKHPGEATDEQTTVCTVITIDPLWMDVNVPYQAAQALRVGQEARVAWEDVEGLPEATGTVVFISPAGHGGARQRQVRLEVPNPGKLPSGLHGIVRFQPTTERSVAGNGGQ